jgi:hypothetical protein
MKRLLAAVAAIALAGAANASCLQSDENELATHHCYAAQLLRRRKGLVARAFPADRARSEIGFLGRGSRRDRRASKRTWPRPPGGGGGSSSNFGRRRRFRPTRRRLSIAATPPERLGGRLKGEVQSWNTMGDAAIIARRASWLSRIAASVGAYLPPRKLDGRGRDAVGASSVPATSCSKRSDAKPGPGRHHCLSGEELIDS